MSMPPDQDRLAGYRLLEDGALVRFAIVESKVESTFDAEETLVQIELQMLDGEEDDESGGDADGCQSVEWGAFGLIFALAVLSFADARPRNASAIDYAPEDEFSVADLFTHLSFRSGELQLDTDYVRGRCMKTEVTVRPSGRVSLATRCRGEAALRWVNRLKGERPVRAVATEA